MTLAVCNGSFKSVWAKINSDIFRISANSLLASRRRVSRFSPLSLNSTG